MFLTQNSSEGGGSCERRHFVLHPEGLSGDRSTAAGNPSWRAVPGKAPAKENSVVVIPRQNGYFKLGEEKHREERAGETVGCPGLEA